MSEILTIVVHGAANPNKASMRAANRVADHATELVGAIHHGHPVFVRHDTATVNGKTEPVLIYVVKAWTRDDNSEDDQSYLKRRRRNKHAVLPQPTVPHNRTHRDPP